MLGVKESNKGKKRCIAEVIPDEPDASSLVGRETNPRTEA